MSYADATLDELEAGGELRDPRTCEVFLAHRAGFQYEEIAAELGISTRTVKKHVSRGKSLLGIDRRNTRANRVTPF